MFRRILAAAAAALALFHAWLFAGQALQGQLADPALLARWAAAAALVAALAALHRGGASLVRGRRAVGIWLLAALLHGPAIGARVDALETPAVPETAAAVAQLGAIAAGLFLLLWIARAPRPRPAARYETVVPRAAIGVAAARAGWACAPRPPPSVESTRLVSCS